MQLPAVIWLPDIPDADAWLARCLAYVERMGYHLIGIVEESKGGRWRDASRLAFDERAVLVVGDLAHLPTDRLPRVEFVTQTREAGSRWSRPLRILRQQTRRAPDEGRGHGTVT
ncbi:MAG TPA: hypothetical protein VFC00_12290 [Micromonosporaceae bacterium]|nr:hypothetical protein [Micromonosporaceae bacterium]